ncbi:hypothetical protein DPMN_032264 [Dreissena polymorpha]|uniref:Uncharacterized protein n=1 Tax=Dreissena polymorpha TaxID=45954 RepID=A0A9D4M1I1_DREPO|nr:hypothetical protein DPMN_032264 [Dreissena polymorpha]
MAEGAKQPHVPETHRTPGFSIISSSRLRLINENASVEMSKVLNILGFGPELRQYRRECYSASDNVYKWCDEDNIFDKITVGSKAEGISRCFESDLDLLWVLNLVECHEAIYDINSIKDNTTVFRMDTQICYPGHCILLHERGFSLLLSFALCDNGHGQVCLSSDALLNFIERISSLSVYSQFHHERAGPSLPHLFGPCKYDSVLALRCHCPSILQKWAARSRHWPPPDIVSKVVSMGAFLTPVGFKGSENKNIEWRMCFNTGEGGRTDDQS